LDRRAFLRIVAGGVLAARVATAQPRPGIVRLGYLTSNLSASPHLHEAFRQGLRELGYVEGRNLTIEYRDAKGTLERLPALADELVARSVDLIVTAGGTPAALAAKHATRTLPIVFTAVADPVTDGLVPGLANPGSNVTGLSLLIPDLVGKRLEQFKQAIPGISQIAVLWQPGGLGVDTRNRTR
jgi:putative ABC transport system substrate-binding protein